MENAVFIRVLSIGHFGKYHNIPCLSPQILHKQCFCFLLGPSVSVLRETMLMQHLAVQTKSIVVFSEMAYIRRDQINPCQLIGKTGSQIDICLASQSARRSVKQQVLISVHSMHLLPYRITPY